MSGERSLRICFRSGAVIDGQMYAEQDADTLLRLLGQNVDGWLFGQNPKVLFELSNGAVLIDRREVESAQVLTSEPPTEGADDA